MGQGMPMELTKIKKIATEIQDFSANMDSPKDAKNARELLKKYSVLSEKIERNVLISSTCRKELAQIRTAKFKEMRRTLKEKANSILQAKNNKKTQTENVEKKSAKQETVTKVSKAAAEKPVKKAASSIKSEKKIETKAKKPSTAKESEKKASTK